MNRTNARSSTSAANGFGCNILLKGLYAHGELIYFHTEVKNATNVPFDVDFVTFKIVDKKMMKRTAMQEQVIYPLRAYQLCDPCGRQKTRADGVCPAQVHHSRRQEADSGNV